MYSETWLCEECGNTFNESRIKRVFQPDGDSWSECPYCGSDEINPAVQCDRCGDWFALEYYTNISVLNEGLCPDCLRKEARNVRQVLEYGEAHKTDAKLNAVLLKAFTERQINDLVMNAFVNLPDEVQRKAAVDCADDDLMAYAEWLKKEEWI